LREKSGRKALDKKRECDKIKFLMQINDLVKASRSITREKQLRRCCSVGSSAGNIGGFVSTREVGLGRKGEQDQYLDKRTLTIEE